MAVRAITFDFWMTLFADDVDRSKLRRQLRIDAFCEATGADEASAFAAFHRSQEEFLRHHIEEQRTLAPHDAVDFMLRELSVSLDAEAAANMAKIFGEAILEYPPDVIPGALEAVRAAAAHRPIGIISDAGLSPGYCLEELLRRNGFADFFSTLVFSDVVGVSKPQAKMFETAAQGLGVDVSELLHIGDLEPTDIVGAHGVGAQAALFTGANDKYQYETTAHHVFHAWDSFVEAAPALLG